VRDPEGALALATYLIEAAEGGTAGLGGTLSRALAELRRWRDALGEALRPVVATPRGVQAADRVEDNAVGALHDWLRAYLRLPEEVPERSRAEALYRAFFGQGGLGFLRERAHREWAQVEARMKALEGAEAQKDLAALGGKAFWGHLVAAHKAYGEVLGTAASAGKQTPEVRERMDALLRAMRIYVVRVSATVDETEPESQAAAEALLRPLSNWETVRRSSAAGTEAPAEGAGEGGTS